MSSGNWRVGRRLRMYGGVHLTLSVVLSSPYTACPTHPRQRIRLALLGKLPPRIRIMRMSRRVTKRKSQPLGHTGKYLDFSAGLFESHHRHYMRNGPYKD